MKMEISRYPRIVFIFILIIYPTLCSAAENIFYVLRYSTEDRMTSPTNTLNSLKKNYKKIDILIPQAYTINATGEVKKSIEPEILNFAVDHHMTIMPLVTNTHFDGDVAHQFLLNTSVQAKAINTLVDICKQHHFAGIQLDFEMINIKDRDALTRFYTLAADEFHKNGLHISFALAPIVTDEPTSFFLKKIYENWEGAYDLKALGKIADFVSIMAYNQHGGSTTPGPTATLPWVHQTVKYALQFIPANKISLGIADYSTHWYTGSTKINNKEKVCIQSQAMNYQQGITLAHDNHSSLFWHHQANIHYAIFSKNWLNEYLFIEDKKSFIAKYKLIKKYELRGVSVFDLGTEDPEIWKTL